MAHSQADRLQASYPIIRQVDSILTATVDPYVSWDIKHLTLSLYPRVAILDYSLVRQVGMILTLNVDPCKLRGVLNPYIYRVAMLD